MVTLIEIGDTGTQSAITIDGAGNITVLRTGGCPVANILAGLEWSDNPTSLAQSVLDMWLDGYEDGLDAARENRLHVTVRDEEGAELADVEA